MCSCRTIDYAGLYILPHGRIYERLQAGSIALGAHVRQCHSEPEDCKGLLAKQLRAIPTKFGVHDLVQQQRPPPFAPPTDTPIL